MPRAAEPFGRLRERAVYLPGADALVAADLHLGRAAASAVDAPLGECRATVDRLLALVDRFAPAEVVLAGDVLDAFDRVPREARDALASLREGVGARDAALVVLEGNHDAQLAALLDQAPAANRELSDGTVVCHGHEHPGAGGARYVVGHDHPTIDIEGLRRPCYLFGPGAADGADVLALPAFNAGLAGTSVNGWGQGDPLSPLLADAPRFHPVVWDDGAGGALVFPTLAALEPYL